MALAETRQEVLCYHCGESCTSNAIMLEEKPFCCEGCKMVYQVLNKSGFCEYYQLNSAPGANQRIPVRENKFAFLEDQPIEQKLLSFKDETNSHVTFYLPQIHCSSCLYLLENLHRLNNGIISCKVNFPRKEVELVFDHTKLSLRQSAELLTSIGYEPYISLNDLKGHGPKFNRTMLYQLGIAGFCFANIMLLSFPEYLGLQNAEIELRGTFRLLNLILALPVFFYSALPFYSSGWKGIRHRYLNIDAPIALAIIVTFCRSVYEVISGTGAGYFDSMSGIVFFMLAGRVLQNKTYEQLSFDRDYTSYFPVAVDVLKDGLEIPTALPEIKAGDTLLIHNEELIPADGILTRGKAFIDYSFVTGETVPVRKEIGEIVYAGGRQVGASIELLVIREVVQSQLTSLWLKDEYKKGKQESRASFVQGISRWFSYIVFAIAVSATVCWIFIDNSKAWNVFTAVLIVACPCALLLSNTFVNGNILRILGRNGFFLKSAQTIENIASINHIVFDKTGTITETKVNDVDYYGTPLSKDKLLAVVSLASQSSHPLSKSLVNHYGRYRQYCPIENFCEIAGMGIEGFVEGTLFSIGSKQFITGEQQPDSNSTKVYLGINGKLQGYFIIRNHLRISIPRLFQVLQKKYSISLLSGDNNAEQFRLRQLFGINARLLFNQKPGDKLRFIESLQEQGQRVMMVGDGLNDAGALRKSDVGIAVSETSNNFTPASDAIIDAGKLPMLPEFIRLCKLNKKIVLASFILSIVYNLVGLCFAVSGILSPMVAAILMPSSSLSILLVTFGVSNFAAQKLLSKEKRTSLNSDNSQS